MQGWLARWEMEQGNWDDAMRLATSVVEHPGIAATSRVTPLAVIGRLRARRGEPDPWGPLDEALELAREADELQRYAPVAAARAEVRWLAGEDDRIDEETSAVLELALARGDSWTAGDMCAWRRRAGVGPPPDRGLIAEPFALELDDPVAAAAWWTHDGWPWRSSRASRDPTDSPVPASSSSPPVRSRDRPAAPAHHRPRCLDQDCWIGRGPAAPAAAPQTSSSRGWSV